MRFCALIVKELLRAIRRKNFLLTFIRTYVEFYVRVTVARPLLLVDCISFRIARAWVCVRARVHVSEPACYSSATYKEEARRITTARIVIRPLHPRIVVGETFVFRHIFAQTCKKKRSLRRRSIKLIFADGRDSLNHLEPGCNCRISSLIIYAMSEIPIYVLIIQKSGR